MVCHGRLPAHSLPAVGEIGGAERDVANIQRQPGECPKGSHHAQIKAEEDIACEAARMAADVCDDGHPAALGHQVRRPAEAMPGVPGCDYKRFYCRNNH